MSQEKKPYVIDSREKELSTLGSDELTKIERVVTKEYYEELSARSKKLGRFTVEVVRRPGEKYVNLSDIGFDDECHSGLYERVEGTVEEGDVLVRISETDPTKGPSDFADIYNEEI